jgi:hypothetical protein
MNMLIKVLDRGISLHRRPFPAKGNLEYGAGAHIPGTLIDERRRAVMVGHPSVRDSMKGTLREGSFTGNPKNMLSKAQKWTFASTGAQLLGNMEGRFFLRAFLYRGNFMRLSRDMQMPRKSVSLSIGVLLGNLEGVCLPGLLRE